MKNNLRFDPLGTPRSGGGTPCATELGPIPSLVPRWRAVDHWPHPELLLHLLLGSSLLASHRSSPGGQAGSGTTGLGCLAEAAKLQNCILLPLPPFLLIRRAEMTELAGRTIGAADWPVHKGARLALAKVMEKRALGEAWLRLNPL